MRIILLIMILMLSKVAKSQVDEVYIVTADNLNVRSGPGTTYGIVTQLKKGQEVVVTEIYNSSWFKVDIGFNAAYVFSKLITNDPTWKKLYLSNGSDPYCKNITPREDTEMDNYLKIKVGSNTDVVIKLMRISNYSELCVRIAYVRSNDSFEIKNIPEGKYYLKMAYGRDWRQKNVAGRCYGKFMRSPLYKKGDQVLDFNLQQNADGYSIPSFELSLDIVASDFQDDFQTNGITEEEFNN
ncbi:SH3 domain-containing protein [Cyclobacteriaceae bacterium]|nr:SH3 domain-containing protein [Cyclobacteriaceae bacterium]